MERSLLTTGEVAAALGVTSARVRQMVLSGLLQAEKAGRDVLIPIAEVDAAKQRKTRPGPKPKDETATVAGAAEAVTTTKTPAAEPLTPKVKAEQKAKRVKAAVAALTEAKPKRTAKKANGQSVKRKRS